LAGELQYRSTDGALLYVESGPDAGKLAYECCCCSDSPCDSDQCGHNEESYSHVSMTVTVSGSCDAYCENFEGTYDFATFTNNIDYRGDTDTDWCRWVWERYGSDGYYYWLRLYYQKSSGLYYARLSIEDNNDCRAYFGGAVEDYECVGSPPYACAYYEGVEEVDVCCAVRTSPAYRSFRQGDTFELTGRADPCNDCGTFGTGCDCSGCTATVTVVSW